MDCSIFCRLSLEGRGRIARRFFSASGDPGEGGATNEDSLIRPLTLALSLKSLHSGRPGGPDRGGRGVHENARRLSCETK
jgi:hypothetical protein